MEKSDKNPVPNLQVMQDIVDKWIKQFPEGYWLPHAQMSVLAEETGEVARAINHLHGPKKKKNDEALANLEAELGDVLFTITCLANSHGLSLDQSFNKAMETRYGRDNKRFERYDDKK